VSDGDALLAAIRAHPDEDVPRLAYADWLDETGVSPARARFVRLMIDPHIPKRYPQYRDADALALGCPALSIPQVRAWGLWPFAGLWSKFKVRYRLADRAFVLTAINRVGVDYLPQSVTVRRGFVAGVRTDYAGWVAHGDAIAAAHPITRVSIDCGGQPSDFDPRTVRFLERRHPAIAFDMVL
jgi:uncharacterized protein (TIGR02996 family)